MSVSRGRYELGCCVCRPLTAALHRDRIDPSCQEFNLRVRELKQAEDSIRRQVRIHPPFCRSRSRSRLATARRSLWNGCVSFGGYGVGWLGCLLRQGEDSTHGCAVELLHEAPLGRLLVFCCRGPISISEGWGRFFVFCCCCFSHFCDTRVAFFFTFTFTFTVTVTVTVTVTATFAIAIALFFLIL